MLATTGGKVLAVLVVAAVAGGAYYAGQCNLFSAPDQPRAEADRGGTAPPPPGTGQPKGAGETGAAALIARDRELYAAVRKSPTRATCEAYLASATDPARSPFARMKADVGNYRKHLDKMDGELELTIKVTSFFIGSRDKFNFRNFAAEVQVDGTAIASQSGQTWSEEASYPLPTVKQTFRRKLDQTISITGRVWNESPLGGPAELGDLKWTGTAAELTGGKTLEFSRTKYYAANGRPSTVTIAVEGVPAAPTLPAYPE